MNEKPLDRRVFHPGQCIFKEGDKGDFAYVVETGVVHTIRKTPTAGYQLLSEIKDGGIFGEMALLDNSSRMASAVAIEATTCILINKHTLQGKFKHLSPELTAVIRIMLKMARLTLNESSPPTPSPQYLSGLQYDYERLYKNAGN